MVKIYLLFTFTSLQSNNDPFLLQSSSDDCEQSCGPIWIPYFLGKSRFHWPYFKLYFIAFSFHLESHRGGFVKARASQLARVSSTNPCQSTLFYTGVAPFGATISQTTMPTAQPKIHFKFKKMQPIDCKF